jgi:hypothetical protein
MRQRVGGREKKRQRQKESQGHPHCWKTKAPPAATMCAIAVNLKRSQKESLLGVFRSTITVNEDSELAKAFYLIRSIK